MNIRPSSILFLASLLGSTALTSLAADQQPRSLTQLAPVYPGEMQHANREGAVLVAFTITAQGDVADAVVISSTKRAFEAPTLNAVKQWKFTPGTKGGAAVSTPARQLVTFMNSSNDLPATTSRLVTKLRVRNPEAIVASAWQPEVSATVVRTAASGTTLTTSQP